MSRIAIIPARGGSQRIPRKNIRNFMGKPMMQWPVEALKKAYLFDLIVVSTDDVEICDLARSLGCDVHTRPKDDGSMGTQEIASCIVNYRMGSRELAWPADEYCVVYPCTPMLTPEDIWSSLGLWRASGKPFSRSVVGDPATDAGAVYWGYASAFRQRAEMQGNCHDIAVDDHRFIDINTFEDWAIAESKYQALRRAQHED